MRKRTTPPSPTGQAAKLTLCCLLFVCLVLGRGCRCDKNGKDSNTKSTTIILVPIGESTPPAVAVGVWADRPRRPDEMGPGPYCDVIVAIWKDGRVIWSEEDALISGPPYFEGSIDPKVLAEFLAEVDNKGWFNDPVSKQHNWGPDSGWIKITILGDGGKLLNMGSWHELFEANPNLVADATGIGSLDGRDRAQVLAQQPEDYRRFRAIWSELRNRLQELIPADGKIVEGLQFKERRIEIGEAR